MVKRWIPLEANPDVLNRLIGKLGVDTKNMAFCDVYGLEEVKPDPMRRCRFHAL